MARFRATVKVRRKGTVADPEGKTISEALARLGYRAIEKVRTGKVFTVDLEARDEAEARRIITAVSTDVLSNPIIEVFEFDIEGL